MTFNREEFIFMTESASVTNFKKLLYANKNKVESFSAGKSEIYIFGAGNTSKLYAKSFSAENICPAGFLDNDQNKQGKPFLDCPVTGGGSFTSFTFARAQ